jgi:predicted metalloprotease
MRLDDLRPSGNMDDRRGRGFGGGRMVLGGGGLGVVGILVLSLLFGVDPSQLLGPMTEDAPQQASSGPRADDAAYDFARRVTGSAEDIWQPILQREGVRFMPATTTVYDNATPTGCGTGQASAGPFYCPSDAHIYLDLTFFNDLASRFGAPGEFARAYVIAHEYGHHIQNLIGVMGRRDMDERGAEGASVRTELQADCFAGVWAFHANRQFRILESGDVESGLRAASAVGDDTLQSQGQGHAVPDSFTHGSSAQRVHWFQRGLENGEMRACDTFAAGVL